MSSALLESTYKQYHTEYVFVCFTSLSIYTLKVYHVVTKGRISFIVVAVQYFIVYEYVYTYISHIFLIHLSIDGHR